MDGRPSIDRRRFVAAGAGAVGALAGCLGSAFGETVTETVSESYDVGPETVVSVSNRNGDVTVDPTDDDELSLTGEKRANSESGLDSISIDVTEGERFSVEVTFQSGSDFESRSVDLTVAVPDGVRVTRAATENGDVSAGGVRGDLEARTSNGTVELFDVDGFVGAETTNGDVVVRDTTGLDGARTTNGDVDVDLLAMRGDVTCRSVNGDVTVAAGEDVSAAIRMETDTGEATVEGIPHTVENQRRGFVRGQLRGGGERTLSLRTTNGDVRLEAA